MKKFVMALSICFAQYCHRTIQTGLYGWLISLALYTIFAGLVFTFQGLEPLLGPDHVTYMELADSIMANRPDGDYWKETNSVRSYGVMLAYLYQWTDSHLVSMKIVLFICTILYLIAAELFFAIFAEGKGQAILFALLSAFAVSFGISSWGVTDSTALLARTLGLPFIIFSLVIYFRYYDATWKYMAFPLLVIGSLFHLGCLHFAAVLGLLEAWDFATVRRCRIDARFYEFIVSIFVSAGLLFWFEWIGVSVSVFQFVLASLDLTPPKAGSGTLAAGSGTSALSPDQAWSIELKLRPWRNMLLPLTNVANVLSSYTLILALALAGVWRCRRVGVTRYDRIMMAFFVIIPVFAFLPQTLVWLIRSFLPIYPINFEEIRSIGFIMIPSLYFVLRLYQEEARSALAWVKTAGIVIVFLALPLTMKSLPVSAREAILSVVQSIGIIDPANQPQVENARAALGIAHSTRFYYSTLGVMDWLRVNTPTDARILSDRDELVLLRPRLVIGSRQVAAVPPQAKSELPDYEHIFFELRKAIQLHDLQGILRLARQWNFDYVVLPWPVPEAAYRDENFSVLQLIENRNIGNKRDLIFSSENSR